MFGIFFISENTFFNTLDPENTQDKSGIDSRGFKWLQNRFRKVSICSHVVVNRNNLLSVCVQNMWVNKRVEEVEERECVCRHWVKGQSSSRSTDDAVSHPQEHTGRMVDWTLCDSWSQSSSPPLIPLELCLHSASQQQGPVRAALHTSCCCFSLWILRTQLSLRPHTLSSSHSAPLRSLPSVERRRHQCFQRLTSSAVSQWCSTSSRKSSRDFSPVQRWSSFLSASCSRVGMNTLRAQCVSSACQSAEWTPERWIYCCYRWSHVSLCEHVHIKGAGFTAYDQSQTWTVWLTAEPHISQRGSNCSLIKIRGEQTHDPE